ncbi:hypothetical protein CBP27_07720, partial [Fischerella thermalis WC542]
MVVSGWWLVVANNFSTSPTPHLRFSPPPHLMRSKIENDVLFLHHEDVPEYKKGGSVVRNSYFWALRSIAGKASRYGD